MLLILKLVVRIALIEQFNLEAKIVEGLLLVDSKIFHEIMSFMTTLALALRMMPNRYSRLLILI